LGSIRATSTEHPSGCISPWAMTVSTYSLGWNRIPGDSIPADRVPGRPSRKRAEVVAPGHPTVRNLLRVGCDRAKGGVNDQSIASSLRDRRLAAATACGQQHHSRRKEQSSQLPDVRPQHGGGSSSPAPSTGIPAVKQAE
jgi:hypothetical protein